MRFNLYSLILAFFFLSNGLLAQIIITNETFPVVGDVIRTTSALDVMSISMTPPGGDQFWDFGSIQTTGSPDEVIFVDPSESENSAFFPSANLMLLDEDGETFFQSTEEDFSLLGFSGGDPTGLGVDLVAALDPPLVEGRAPLAFFDINTYGSETNIPFGADELPGGILDSFPISPDSIRVRVIIDRTDVVDAWGTINIPGNVEYDVLRQKRIELSETRIDVKIGPLEWTDVTDLFGGGMDFFGGVDTLVTYNFLSNDAKEPIAVFNLDGNEEVVFDAEFKFEEEDPNSIEGSIAGIPYLFAYPNPAINEVKFDFKNLESGTYKLKIFNILGLEAYSEEYFVTGNKTVKLDISRLKKGTYLYSLVDENGKTMTTKRLIVVRP